jgi:ATP-dependent Clp protease adaptor protein ClpS
MSTKKQRKEGIGHDVDLEDRQKLEPPKKYKVVLYNDDYTSMEFVVIILMDIFNYGVHRAHEVMLQVHEQGKGIAGVYSKEIAIMKVKRCNQISRKEGHPLMVSMEQE